MFKDQINQPDLRKPKKGEGLLIFEPQKELNLSITQADDEKQSNLRELRAPYECPETQTIYEGEWLGDVRDG